MQFLEICKKDFNPTFEPVIVSVNYLFGCATTALAVTFLCFYLLLAHFIPIGIEKYFIIEENHWIRFSFNFLLVSIVFFFAGLWGLISACILLISATFDLICSLKGYREKEESTEDMDSI